MERMKTEEDPDSHYKGNARKDEKQVKLGSQKLKFQLNKTNIFEK